MTWIYPISGWDTYGTPVGDHPGASKMRIPDWVSHMNARPTWSKFRQHGFALLKTCEKLRAWGDFAGAKQCLKVAKKAREMEQLHKEHT